MSNFFLVFLAGIISTAATCQSTPVEIKIKDVSVAPCMDQDSLFSELISKLNYKVRENEISLDFVFTAACCQKIDLALEQENSFPRIDIKLLKSGEICDCYCNYPVKAILVIPNLKRVPAIELFINKKPAGKIPTGY